MNGADWLLFLNAEAEENQTDFIAEDRSQGYSCKPEIALAGADRAIRDLRAATLALRQRPVVSEHPILLSGISRGGALSITYAGQYPNETQGVINFVGAWMGDACTQAETINQTLFKKGGQ